MIVRMLPSPSVTFRWQQQNKNINNIFIRYNNGKINGRCRLSEWHTNKWRKKMGPDKCWKFTLRQNNYGTCDWQEENDLVTSQRSEGKVKVLQLLKDRGWTSPLIEFSLLNKVVKHCYWHTYRVNIIFSCICNVLQIRHKCKQCKS